MAGWLFQNSLGCLKIKLYNLFTSHIPCIGYLNLCENLVFGFPHCGCIKCEGGVGKAVSKWINHFFLCARDGFKIAVTYIDVLGIVYIIK